MEPRRLLSGGPQRNALNPLDANADGIVAALDALVVIDYLNAGGGAAAAGYYPDVNGDAVVAPDDALAVLNHLSPQGLALESAANAATVNPLGSLSLAASTADKPQSKLWRHAGHWWSVLGDAAGTSLYRLDGITWTSVLPLAAGFFRADVLAVGDVTHVLLAAGAGSKLVSLELVPGSPPSYQAWSSRPAAGDVPLSASAATATLAADSTGRLWIASDTSSAIEVRYSDAPYANWSAPVTLATGVGNSDISAVAALGDRIGVMWSNRITQRFGFRTHQDGDDPAAWSADEQPGAADAVADGNGLSNDHLHLASTSDGTLFAAVKTGYTDPALPSVGLLVRSPAGAWSPLHMVDALGSRPIVVVNEAVGRVTVAYRKESGKGPIMARESDLSAIAFGDAYAVVSGSAPTDPTSTKQTFVGELAILAAAGTTVEGALLASNSPPLVSAGPDQQVLPAQTVTLAGSASDDGQPQSLVAAWTAVSGPGSVSFADAASPQTTAQFSAAGSYVLRLSASDGEYERSDELTVVVDATAPTVSIDAVLPDPHTGPLDALQITFSESVAGFNPSDLHLSRGGGNLLDGSQTLTSADNVNWTLAGLTGLTAVSGTYTLTLAAASAGIVDLVGNALLIGASRSFQIDVSTPYEIYPLADLPISLSTAAKPQSKIWWHAGSWWSVQAVAAGTSVFRLDGATWTAVLSLSSTKYRADVKPVGDGGVVHVLLFGGSSSRLASIEFVPGNPGSYQAWSARPSLTNVSLNSNAETATLDIDSTGRMWVVSDTNSAIEARSAASPYSSFGSAFTLASGVTADDLAAVTALPTNQIGVFWSNQSAKRFGFRLHNDGAATNTWLAAEVPASQSAQNVGGGMADDHVNLAVAADGTLYAAVRTAYNTAGQTAIGLLVRRPNGSWDDLYQVDTSGANPLVVLNEQTGRIVVAYGAGETAGPIYYRESAIGQIGFGARKTLLADATLSDPSSLRGSFGDQLLVVASNSTTLSGAVLGVNAAPAVDAGPDGSAVVGAAASVAGSVVDDGLPLPHSLTVAWSLASGPGGVSFGDAAAAATSATFSAPGVYVLRLEASDGQRSAADEVTFDVLVPNLPPTVDAGADQTALPGAAVALDGTVSDDGIPDPPAALTTAWSVVNGPGSVAFADAAAVDTTASFELRGVYVLRLSAFDGRDTASDEVTVTIDVPNLAPTVSAGADQLAALGASLQLLGTASDDGEPQPPAALAVSWSLLSGPGSASFSTPNAAQTGVTFSLPGRYELRLSADDGAVAATDDVIVDVVQPSEPIVREYQYGALPTPAYAGTKDTKLKEERPLDRFGGSATLEADGGPGIVSLIEFDLSEIPPGSTIDAASLSLRVSGGSQASFELHELLTEWSEDQANWLQAAPNRPWVRRGAQHDEDRAEASLGEVSPSNPGVVTITLNSLGIAALQRWVNRPATNHGMLLTNLMTDDALALASSEAATIADRPRLSLSWRLPGAPPLNHPPEVSAGADQSAALHAGAELDGSVTDDGLPQPPGEVTTAWSVVSGPGAVTFDDPAAVDTHAQFSAVGQYVLRLTAFDGRSTVSDELTVIVEDLSIPVQAAFQDGVSPEPSYGGTRDTKLRFERPTTNYGDSVNLDFDGSPDFASLLAWDVSQIPPGSLIRAATIELNVLAASVDSFELYRLTQQWSEAEATWDVRLSGVAWQTGGAAGSADHASEVAGTLTAPALGPTTITLNAAGVAALQDWVDRPEQNFGFLLQDYQNATDLLTVDSADSLTPGLRPKLSVTYLRPGAPPPNDPPAVSAGADVSVGLGQSAELVGSVVDDGRPAGGSLEVQWSKLSGPGEVAFANPAFPSTAASFSAPGEYVLQLTASDGEAATSDTMTATVVDLSLPVVREFQDGVWPDPAYAGTRDAKLRFEKPTTNYGGSTNLDVDGSPAFAALVQWDVAAVPAGRQVLSAALTVNVVATSVDAIEIYELLRPWQESTATWNEFDAGSAWQTAGAAGAADRGSAVLGVLIPSALGPATVLFNPAGVAAVQGWVDHPEQNFGLVFQDYSALDAATFNSREAVDPQQRPKLSLTFLPQQVGDLESGGGQGSAAAAADAVLAAWPEPISSGPVPRRRRR